MKMKFKYAALFAAALTMGLTGCSNEDNPLDGVDTGVPTEMTLRISFPETVTKAADSNAKEGEGLIKTVDMFVYNSDKSFNKHVSIPRSSLTPSTGEASNHQYTARIATSTGNKYFHVGINLPAAVVTAAKTQAMDNLSATLITAMTRAEMTTVTNGLPMFSKPMAATQEMKEGENTVTLAVQRMVAKITVEKSATINTTGLDAQGTIDGDLSFGIFNFNKKQFLVQSTDKKDPNWTREAIMPTADFDVAPDWAAVNAAGTTVQNYTPLYTSENTSEGKRKGEITRATVRGKFVPKKVITDAAGTEVENQETTGVDFWAYGDKFFNTLALAEAYVTAKSGDVTKILKYTGGYCYWHIYLNKSDAANKYDVLRNNYLKCTIDKIAGIGRNTPDIPWTDGDPDEENQTPDEADAKLTATINIEAWNMVSDNYTLDK